MIELRIAESGDIPACGQAMYLAFKDIAEQHNFPPDFPSSEAAGGLLQYMHGSPGFDAFLAEQNGEIIGSIFVSRRSPVGGISCVTVDPGAQNRAAGRQLMQHGMLFLADQGHSRQQLIQAAYHNRSLCLYAKLGFAASDMLSAMTGSPIKTVVLGRKVRQANENDLASCNALSRKVHGFDRAREVSNAIAQGAALVVECDGEITGYTTGIGYMGHGVGEGNEDMKALIGSVDEFSGPGLLIPTSNTELFRWCLDNGLRVVQQMTLMDTAPLAPSTRSYWPSILC